MGFDAIGIICNDIQKSIEFYSHFDLEFQKFGEGHFEARTQSGIRIMLDSVDLMKEIDPDFKELTTGGVVICFTESSPEAVDSRIIGMSQNGYKVRQEPFDAFWGQRYASLMDPDGNQVHVFADLPDSSQK